MSVLFTFDTDFVKTFGANAMDKVMALVKNHFNDKSLRKLIGTTVKVTGTKRKYSKAFTDKVGTGCRGKGDW